MKHWMTLPAFAAFALSAVSPALGDTVLFTSVAVNAFAQSKKCNYTPQRVRLAEKRGDQEIFVSPALPPLTGTCIAMCRLGRCEVVVQK